MDNTFVLRGKKSEHFSRPPDFASSPPQEVGLTQIPGGRQAKILTTNHFLFFKKYVRALLFKTGILFCSLFSLYTISKGRQIQSLASQE